MLIYLETIRTQKNEFEFIHSHYIGAGAVDEKIYKWVEPENDRLRAAIVNAGYAANALSDLDTGIKVIGIESDIDGKATRDGGEHDILFSLLCPKDDFEGRKQRSLYNDYARFLGRLRQLILMYEIKIVLQDRDDIVRYN